MYLYACTLGIRLIIMYTHNVILYSIYLYNTCLPKYVYTLYNIIMCHRRKHLGTATENGHAVKVGLILCTGCSRKTEKYKVTLNHK